MSEQYGSIKSHEKVYNLQLENQTLLDKISILRLQCKVHEDETKKAVEKLGCLKLLVKRAWSGDYEAAVHVANIVGVAPPLFEFREDHDEMVAIPKPRALNNWASLSAGLLERFYKQREDVMFLKKRQYLLERESYLDSELDGYVSDSRAKEEKTLDLVRAANQSKPPGTVKNTDRFEQVFIQPQRSRLSIKRVNEKKALLKTVPSTIENFEKWANEALAIGAVTLKEEKKHETNARKNFRNKTRPSSAQPKLTTKTPLNNRPESAIKNVEANKEVGTKITRHKSARTELLKKPNTTKKIRPYSACPVGIKYVSMEIRPSKSYSSVETMRQLNAVEKELRKTTALLQKKLSINPLNFVD